MTIERLCEVFSMEIRATFGLSRDEIEEKLVEGITDDMTDRQIYNTLIAHSMILSADLATHVIVSALCRMGVIPKDFVDNLKERPDLHVLKMPESNAPESPISTDDRKVKKTAKKIKVVKQLTEEQRGKIIERLDKNKPL